MRLMRSAALLAVAVAAILASLSLATRLTRAQTPADKADIERGRYLVENVAMCGECHTPRDANGNLDHQAWLQGAPIWIQPVRRIQNWADHAPALAGLPGFTQQEFERVMEQGIGPEGETLRPPMHIYHMSPADAKAIYAYLSSLPMQIH